MLKSWSLRTTENYPLSDRRLIDLFGGRMDTDAGININEDAALGVSAYYRGITLISQTLAGLPIKIYRKRSDKIGRDVVDDHPAYRLLSLSPDDDLPAYLWRESMQGHVLMRGNAYAEIVRNNRGQAVNCYMLHPDEVHPEWDADGFRQYRVSSVKKGTPIMDRSEILHIPALSWDGLCGISPIRVARNSIGLTIATERYGSQFFRKGGRLLGFLTKSSKINKEQRQHMREEWAELHEGLRNALGVGVLSGGLDWKQISVPPDEAQFLETRKFQVAEIARWLGIPPHMLGDMSKATYNNIEHMLIEFVTFTLLPWVKRWEGELNMKMFTRREQAMGYYAEFNLDGLLRGDIKSRTEALERELRNGVLTINEWRAMLNRNPVDGGDHSLIMASQLATLEAVISGEANLDTTKLTEDEKNAIDIFGRLDTTRQRELLCYLRHLAV